MTTTSSGRPAPAGLAARPAHGGRTAIRSASGSCWSSASACSSS